MNRFKEFCKDFPTQGGSVVVALVLIFFTGVAVIGRLALGVPFPDGYDPWLFFLGALATGTWAAMIGKRLSDFRYKEAGATTTTTTTELPVPVGAAVTTTTTTPDPAKLVRVEQVSAVNARDMLGERGEQ